MELPHVLLRTNTKDIFTYQDGYDKVTNADLLGLLNLGRETLRSLEAELEKRQIEVKDDLSNAVTECIGKFQKTLANLQILGRLDEKASQLVVAAVNALKLRPSNRDSSVYRTFLTDILRCCCRGFVVLCAASIGKQRVVTMNNDDRTRLVHYLKTHKSIFECPLLDILATTYHVPDYSSEVDTLECDRPPRRRYEKGRTAVNEVLEAAVVAETTAKIPTHRGKNKR
ncbi:hypothetical protein CIRG_02163 [Coccidioides immitis RMSCC 2394]|uniref:Uncharacterized protein n=1 Tax=Coccidioides immitis RMSCC 2394 TaxID=404692 RepID=A0A0J6Y4U1_COCIT|nr:hypothetical protein CIRG_02163 [Coccidioides immitis RMSCC 2394]